MTNSNENIIDITNADYVKLFSMSDNPCVTYLTKNNVYKICSKRGEFFSIQDDVGDSISMDISNKSAHLTMGNCFLLPCNEDGSPIIKEEESAPIQYKEKTQKQKVKTLLGSLLDDIFILKQKHFDELDGLTQKINLLNDVIHINQQADEDVARLKALDLFLQKHGITQTELCDKYDAWEKIEDDLYLDSDEVYEKIETILELERKYDDIDTISDILDSFEEVKNICDRH